MTRTRILFVAALFLAFAACSGKTASTPTKDSGTGDTEQPDSAIDGGDEHVLKRPDTGVGNADKDSGSCRTSCESDDCGKVPDGCGEFLDCGGCSDGKVCGAQAPNKCGVPQTEECKPHSAEEVCAGKCGAVSDGCSNIVLCGASNGGVVCSSTQLCVDSHCKDSVASCEPATCATKHHGCGVDGDGCGGSIDCGSCASGKRCAYKVGGNICEDATVVTCTVKTAVEACAGTCGMVGDGCGGQINCQDDPQTACATGTTCGGGGTPNVCGAGSSCSPIAVTIACAGKCGIQTDGCGGTYTCDNTNGGQTCDAVGGEFCGGGGIPDQCGKQACVPKTQSEACPGSSYGKSCGIQQDGCGGQIDCGGCANGETCGLYHPSICEAPPACVPTPASTVCAGKCGQVQEPTCKLLYQCSAANGGVSCTGQEFCGANGVANTCGVAQTTCTPKTCAELGHSCGLASDGCGHVINCWPGCDTNQSCTQSCGSTSSCLADATTKVQSCVAGTPACVGSLCGTVPTTCTPSTPTTLTGTVRTPGRGGVDMLPVPNAVVYIPADPSVALPSIFEGVVEGNAASCGRCSDEKLVADGQSLLAAAVTDYKGDFTLQGRIPVGVAFNLVVKVGKWRRVVQVPSGISAACMSKAVPVDYTRLAASTTDGLSGTHLPKIAVSTGDVDAMECVLRGIGIADSEFTVPSGTGRIHMYRANGTKMLGTTCTGTYRSGFRNVSCSASSNAGCVNGYNGCAWNDLSVADTTLYASQAALNAYDMVVFDCEGNGHYIRGATEKGRALSYTNAGGRVFASHWSYEWLDNNGTLENAAAWVNSGGSTTATGYVSLPSGTTQRAGANPVKSLVYRDWLDWQGALTGTTAGQIDHPDPPSLPLTDPRDVAGATVGTSTDEWMYRDNSGPKVQQLSFNTPYGAAETQICGRVAFSAFHVAASAGGTTLSTSTLSFPNECHTGALTAQEKTLAFMLFDLGACVSAGDPPQPPSCQAKTATDLCPNANDACGYISDGCGGVVDCAGCDPGYYCDGNLCRPQQCTPYTCTSLGYNCGSWPDGCGAIARNSQGVEGCGECTGGQVCGLTTPGICGGCVRVALSTACPANSCGAVSDGCGGTYNCGVCTSGYCGGGGPNLCGSGSCTPLSAATACPHPTSPLTACGLVGDGCGGTINCGTCTAPDTCGGGGAPNVCGHPTCTAKTKQDACNGLSCGWVSDGCGGAINCGTCQNGGVCGANGPNKCGGSCTPTTCGAAGAECGAIADQCGALLNCGPCPTGQTCGASAPNKCGTGTSCTPTTCTAAQAQCGLIGDGCGGALDCGTCTGMLTCGGAGHANKCEMGDSGCNKLTCSAQNVQCGAASDGCGGLLDCGGCASGYYCASGKCNPALF